MINDPDVKHFLEKNRSNLTNEMIDEDLNVLQEYKTNKKSMMDIAMMIVEFCKGHVLNYISKMKESKLDIYLARVK